MQLQKEVQLGKGSFLWNTKIKGISMQIVTKPQLNKLLRNLEELKNWKEITEVAPKIPNSFFSSSKAS